MSNIPPFDLNESFNGIFPYKSDQDDFPFDLKPIDSQQKLYENNIIEYGTKPIFIIKKKSSNSNEMDEDNKELNAFFNTNNLDFIRNQTLLETESPKKELSSLNKKRERSQASQKHDKFSDDSFKRVVKHQVIENLKSFINDKIAKKYNNNIGHGLFIKKLLGMNQKIKKDSSVDFNKDFLNESLGEIFSGDISTRYTNYPLDHNKTLIQSLVNEKNNDVRNYFLNLFKLTFLDALKHFRGTHKTEELDGLTGMDSIRKEYKNNPDFLQNLEYYIFNYENIVNRKRARMKRKQKCK